LVYGLEFLITLFSITHWCILPFWGWSLAWHFISN